MKKKFWDRPIGIVIGHSIFCFGMGWAVLSVGFLFERDWRMWGMLSMAVVALQLFWVVVVYGLHRLAVLLTKKGDGGVGRMG